MANPKLHTLQDPFTAPSLDTRLWNNITGGAVTLDTVHDTVAIAVPTVSATNVFGSSTLYDATGSYVYAQIGPAANGAGHTQTIIRVRNGGSDDATMRYDSGVFRLSITNAGVATSATIGEYDAHKHRWWRLRESGGTFRADTSPDGLTWTERASLPYTWDASRITCQFEAAAGAAEVPGSVVQVSHVNTRAGGPYNPNWPYIEDGWGAYWNANGGAQPRDRYVEISDRTRGTVSVQRGRQYETDQVRSGEASLRLANTDAALDPANATSPFAGHIAPYQPYRRRAQWPPTRNLLEQVAATGGDLGGATGPIRSATTNIFSSADTSGGAFVSTSTAWQGGSVLQFAVPAAAAAGLRVGFTLRAAVAPGQTYTMQIRVRNITASSTVDVKPFFGWYTYGLSTPPSYVYGTSSVLTGSPSAGWTTLTITTTAPANAVGMSTGFALNANTTTAVSVQADGWQLEKGTVATPWTCPGAWSAIYAGFTERWPSSWDMEGLYSVVEPNAVDTFSLLSQQQLSDALTMEMNANNPRFVYKLDDPAGSTTLADWAGNNAPIQIGIGKYGAGSIAFGAAITANDATNGTYTGSAGTVATISNSNPGTNLITGGASFLKLSSAGILGPADPAQWTRMFAFRYTGPAPTSLACLWSAFSRTRANGNPSGSMLYFFITGAGLLRMAMGGPTTGGGLAYQPSNTNVVSDGNWHLAICSYSRATGKIIFTLDGISTFYSADPSTEPTNLVSDNVGGWVDPTVGNGTTYNFKGEMSFIAEFPTALSSDAQVNIYTAWRNAAAGESSSARYQRILRYAKYNGTTNVESGMTTSMGPATIEGQDAMSALQAVVDTENGAHYVDADGVITFRSRSSRYNAFNPAYTFGERVDLGEWPYEECQLDYDSTHLSNQVTVTQEGTSQQFYAVDAASVTGYFPRTMTRSINANNTDECQDAANYLLSRYRQPATRVSTLKLHPSAIPALWPVCLALELGTRVRVMRRPPGAPVVQVECFVENIQWEFSDDGEAWLTLQCSPADLTPYGVVGAWHTSLAVAASAGALTLTINAPQVTQVPAASQIARGQQLILGQGTANAETVTVAAVGATSPGWTTGVIALTAATTKAHAAGDVVCEPLPAGTTDPATWDKVAQFDSIAFAY